ncbi:AlpA family transcriptional regulator [Jeongeupia sp. HS-3]|uniref:helix-turn-helix transcriptional regulator n=1 Tax=Jeongeupia sp. HS-3 TaxID=1009682 RepID=UPI001911225B|nr:AlpA family phage regulatory protein [Jeongeupia sp. HS-3]
MTTSDSFLRLPEVLSIIPVSRATWYEGIKKGRFPAQVKLGPRVAAWRRSDIDRLVASFGANSSSNH